jgi:uncharacterized protein YjiS (DUF1127 family)
LPWKPTGFTARQVNGNWEYEAIGMSIYEIFNGFLTWGSRARTRSQLQELDDRSLADIGISRDLLAAGVGAWPWRAPAEDDTWSPVQRSHHYSAFTRTVAALNARRTAPPLDAGEPGAEMEQRHAA